MRLKLFVTLLLAAGSAQAKMTCRQLIAAVPGLNQKTLTRLNKIHPSAQNLLAHFLALSKIFRVSGHEAAVRDYIESLALSAGFTVEKDNAGNLLVHIAANLPRGHAAEKVIFHSHMDLVPAVKDIDSREKAEAYLFEHGVGSLELVDGWIRTKNKQNSNGADNGLGLALMLEYITNPKLVHGPIDAFFTVEEETTMLGAREHEFKLDAPYMISLDGDRSEVAYNGSLGGREFDLHLDAPPDLERIRAGYETVSLKLSGLHGGHSGVDIHHGYANAVLEMASLIQRLTQRIPELQILGWRAGTEGVYNAIPQGFTLSIAVEPAQKTTLEELATDFRRDFAQRCSRVEDISAVTFQIESALQHEHSVAFPWKYVKPIVQTMTSIANGLYDLNWPLRTSDTDLNSNSSFSTLDEKHGLNAGYFPRYLDQPSLTLFMDHVQSTLDQNQLSAQVTVAPDGFDPWRTTHPHGFLAQTLPTVAAAAGYTLKLQPVRAGLEAGYFGRQAPQMDIAVLGHDITGEHSGAEQHRLEGPAETMKIVELTLHALIIPPLN